MMNEALNKKIVVAMPGLHRIGGIETFCVNAMRGFARTGWEVHCLVTNYRGDAYGEIDGVTFHDLSVRKLSLRKPIAAARLINEIGPGVVLSNHCSLVQHALPLLDRSIKPVVVLHSDDELLLSNGWAQWGSMCFDGWCRRRDWWIVLLIMLERIIATTSR